MVVLNGVGEKIASRTCPKVLLLNGLNDNETRGFSASSFVTAITEALNRTHGKGRNRLQNAPKDYIDTVFMPGQGLARVDGRVLEHQQIFHMTVNSAPIFDPGLLINELARVARPALRER
uniref:Uncharacterized protein n=1 Tax=Kalanchoe fedtschenkoi TaxID=63787 RepID=A0A7N0VJZ5_KALFE